MKPECLKRRVSPVLLLLLSASLILSTRGVSAQPLNNLEQAGPTEVAISWQSHARLHRIAGKKHGDIVVGAEGIEFRFEGRTLRWPFLEIKTFSISSHSLAIETYANRNGHLPGMQRYRFDLEQTITPEAAAGLARQVQRPSQNAVPDPASPSLRNVLAHHRMRTHGTNGALRFREDGIDYVTPVAEDNRSWRWADIQTLSKPDPYHLVVFGYRDTYTFDLKESVPHSLFNRMIDEVASHNAVEPGQMQ